jgi:hypothetical protein
MEAILAGMAKEDLRERLADPATSIRCLSNIRSGDVKHKINMPCSSTRKCACFFWDGR